MALEIKYNLFAEGKVKEISVKKGMAQLSRIKSVLETLFCGDIDTTQWKFVGSIGFITKEGHVKCCENCQKFVLEPNDLENFFDKLHSGTGLSHHGINTVS